MSSDDSIQLTFAEVTQYQNHIVTQILNLQSTAFAFSRACDLHI